MATLSSIKRLYNVASNNLFRRGHTLSYERNVASNNLFRRGHTLSYERVTDAIIALSNAVDGYEDMSDDGHEVWYIGEGGETNLADLIVGAHWHYTEWHGGQWSKGYAALSATGLVYNPGMESCEDDNSAYRALNDMAKRNLKQTEG